MPIKNLLIFTALFIITPVFAVEFDVIGPCSAKPAFKGSFKTDLADNVGIISIDIFEANNIPFIGTEHGMNTIMGTPVGDLAIEILSDVKLRAYGWCFSVNGIIPDKLTSEIYLSKQNDHISWFYAYSTYDQGIWTDYCEPSHTVRSPQFCK